MKLLILTQYFPPEVGAPQNRLFELAIRLKEKGVSIDVITAMPNYPKGEVFDAYKGKKYFFEEIDGINVHRASIYATKSKSIIKRLRNYFSFVRSSYRIYKKKVRKEYDFVLCESPPLFLGISALRITKKAKAQLIFNVSDLWPESAEKLGLVTNKFFLSLAYKLEARLYLRSALVTGQTQGIVSSVNDRFPKVATHWLPNGVDLNYYNPEKIKTDWREKNGFASEDIICLYAGIMGHAQGLEVILNAAKNLEQYKSLKFLMLGSGPLLNELKQLKKDLALQNVYFFDVVTKKEMPLIIKAVDLALVPLKKLDLFKGAIPSKIFENCAMKKTLILGVEGEAKKLFIDEANAGLFFEPENADDLSKKIKLIIEKPELINTFGENAREFVNMKFNRDVIADEFLKKINEI